MDHDGTALPEAKINGTDVNEIKTESEGCICTAWGTAGVSRVRQKDIRHRRAGDKRLRHKCSKEPREERGATVEHGEAHDVSL